MTAQAISDERPVSAWKRRLRSLFSSVLILASLAMSASAIIALGMFQVTAFEDMNPQTWENAAFYGCFFGGAIVAVAVICLADWFRFEVAVEKHGRGYLNSAAAAFVLFALYPAVTLFCINRQPHVLYTPAGYVRVMDDGRVIAEGMTARSDRYVVSSTLVPLSWKRHTLDFASPARNAIAGMKLPVRVKIVPDEAFAVAVRGHEREMSDLGYHAFLLQQSLKPAIESLVRDVESGALAPERAALLLSTGQFAYQHRQLLPSWIRLEKPGVEISKLMTPGDYPRGSP